VRASLAQTLLRLNELPLALVHAQTAVKLRPKRGLYFVIQGDVLAAMGRADDAHAAFMHAYELDPNDAVAKRKAGL
jgi:Flp pilus assembly protein TadD